MNPILSCLYPYTGWSIKLVIVPKRGIHHPSSIFHHLIHWNKEKKDDEDEEDDKAADNHDDIHVD